MKIVVFHFVAKCNTYKIVNLFIDWHLTEVNLTGKHDTEQPSQETPNNT